MKPNIIRLDNGSLPKSEKRFQITETSIPFSAISLYDQLSRVVDNLFTGGDLPMVAQTSLRETTQIIHRAITTISRQSDPHTLQLYSHYTLPAETLKEVNEISRQIHREAYNVNLNADKDLKIVEDVGSETPPSCAIDEIITFSLKMDDDCLFVISFIIIHGEQEEDWQRQAIKLFAEHFRGTLTHVVELRHKVTHDSMTGLYNHGHLKQALSRAWQESRSSEIPLGFLMMDIDRFKNINDSYGHRTGDSLINELGRLVSRHIRKPDIVGRYGGDEIAIVLPGCDMEKTRKTAERLLDVTRTHVFNDSGHPLRFTVSIGIATSTHNGINSDEDLLEAADKALYLAKKSGRNQLCDANELSDKPHPSHFSPENQANNHKNIDDPSLDLGKVLVVDDDGAVLKLLEKILRLCNYEVILSQSSAEALDIVRSGPDVIDVVLSDINMPELNGIELVTAVAAIDPNIVCVIITGYASAENTLAALRAGAYNFIQKPFQLDDIRLVVDRAIERRRMKRQLDSYHVHLEDLLQEKTNALQQTVDELKNSYVNTMETIVSLLDAHETSTAAHSQRVSALSVFLAKKMGVKGEGELNNIRYGALLHDIGKIGIPDAILKKPAPLTENEMNVMKTHVDVGYKIIANVPILREAAEIIHSHHERFDGKGYPQGLKNGEICVGARIFALVDAFDALKTDRFYRPGKTLDEVRAEINACSGTQFDPEVVAHFNRHAAEMDRIYTEMLDARS